MNDEFDLSEVIPNLISFRRARNWEQFHKPKDLAIALSIESSELLDLLLWLRDDEIKESIEKNIITDQIEEEIADIAIYLLYFSLDHKINLKKAILDKIEKNDKKYPVEKFRGKAR